MSRLLTLLAALTLATPAFAKTPVVVIDPGHGGIKEGAVSEKGEQEKVIALTLARRLKTELQKASIKVLLTREGDSDLGLDERMHLANEAGADLFVSIHLNSMPLKARARVRGIETYFLSTEATGDRAKEVAAAENAEAGAQAAPADDLAFILNDLAQTQAHRDSSKLAYTVHQRLVKELEAADRGVHQAPFIVLMGAQMPAILAEVGFLSHSQESRKLVDPAYQKRIARSLKNGIVEFLEKVGDRDEASAAPGTPSALTESPSAR